MLQRQSTDQTWRGIQKKKNGPIRKQAEPKLLGALIKFHYRNIDSNQRQLEKKKSERATKANRTSDVNRHETKALSHTNVNVRERFQLIQKQFELMKNMMSADLENSSNKHVASYPCAPSEYINKTGRVPRRNTKKILIRNTKTAKD